MISALFHLIWKKRLFSEFRFKLLSLFSLISSFLLLRWLVYAQPFFQGVPRVLEVGGYSNPAAWGVEQPYVASLHPLKVVSGTVLNTEVFTLSLLS